MMAGEYAFPIRSLAIARSLFRIHCVGRECAPFSSAHSFGIPSGESGGDDGMAACGSSPRPVPRLVPRLALRPVFSFRIICSLIIVHSCRSRRGGGVFFICLVLRSHQIPRSLPVAYSVSFLVPPFVSPCVSSYLVSLSVSFS